MTTRLAPTPILATGRPIVPRESWSASVARHGSTPAGERSRKALVALNGYLTTPYLAGGGIRSLRPDRLLTTEQLWQLYWSTPDIRSAVDTITRRVATHDWAVGPHEEEDPSGDDYETLISESARIRQFLAVPNADKESWQEVITKMVTDLLVYEAGTIEMVRNGRGKLVELVVPRSDDFIPVVDDVGHVETYVQDTSLSGSSKRVELKPDEVVVFRLFPNTSAPTGRPLIETIMVEAITLLASSDHARVALDADEIPPGILALGGVAAAAANAVRDDFQNLRGKDGRIRIMAAPELDVKWVEMRRSLKDVALLEVVKMIRRTVWRVFGLSPLDMGDIEDVNRSTAEVQADLSSSNLIGPILEMIEAKINGQIIPELVKDPSLIGRIAFAFLREAKLSPAEQLDRVKAHDLQVKIGVMTINEVRQLDGYPPVDGGDTPLLLQGGIWVPLHAVVGGGTPTASQAEGGTDTPATGDADKPGDTTTEPRPRRLASVARGALDLPSDWPSASKFDDHRTLDLRALGRDISAYTGHVRDLYRASSTRVMEILAAAVHADGVIPADQLEATTKAVAQVLGALVTDWSNGTHERYRAAARLGRDAVSTFTAGDVADWQGRADMYHGRAIGYLTAPGGMVDDLRVKLTAHMQAAAMAEPRSVTPSDVRASTAVEVETAGETWLAGAAAILESQEYRIEHWAGRLVELANQTLSDGLIANPSTADGAVTVWYADWVMVGDKNTCSDCEFEGMQGPRPMTALTRQPGGDTECRANCRCVLVLYTQEEVTAGAVADLSPG